MGGGGGLIMFALMFDILDGPCSVRLGKSNITNWLSIEFWYLFIALLES